MTNCANKTWMAVIRPSTVALALCVGPLLPGCTNQQSVLSEHVSSETTGDSRASGGAVGRKSPVDGALTSASETNAGAKPDFSGLWVLNREASDNLQEKMQEIKNSMARGQAMRGGSEGRGRGGGGMGGGQGRGPSGGMMRDNSFSSGELSSLLDTAETLEISHEDPVLGITGPAGQRRRIFTDFRGASISTSGGLQQRVTVAGWEDDALVVETTPDSGPRLIQRYRLDADTGQLVIASRIAFPRLPEPLQVRYVYEPAKTGAISDNGR